MVDQQQSSVQPRRISLIINRHAGQQLLQGEQLSTQLVDYLIAQGAEVTLYQPDDESSFRQALDQALQQQAERAGVLVAAGGDGTLNTVAHRLRQAQQRTPSLQSVTLGIIPLGTFNYVARALQIPLDPLQAAAVIVQGQPQSIHIGCVNQYIYLNNASIGLYPHLIQQRERDNRRFGRQRWVAALSGLTVLLRQHHRLKLRMLVDGQSEVLLTPMVFFGNNQLQLADFKLKIAECAAQGRLAAVAMQPVSRWQMFGLIASLQLGRFEQAPAVQCYCAEQIRIDAGGSQMKLAIDGEIVTVKPPLQFQVAQNALNVMVPHAAASV
ncbi:MAG: diacylglycerol kinase family protein [Moraxellaceae bacterium]